MPSDVRMKHGLLTFTQIDNERSWDRARIDPLSHKVLHLQAGVVGCLQQLPGRTRVCYHKHSPEGRGGRTNVKNPPSKCGPTP